MRVNIDTDIINISKSIPPIIIRNCRHFLNDATLTKAGWYFARRITGHRVILNVEAQETGHHNPTELQDTLKAALRLHKIAVPQPSIKSFRLDLGIQWYDEWLPDGIKPWVWRYRDYVYRLRITSEVLASSFILARAFPNLTELDLELTAQSQEIIVPATVQHLRIYGNTHLLVAVVVGQDMRTITWPERRRSVFCSDGRTMWFCDHMVVCKI